MRDRWARKVIESECNITAMVGAEGTAVAGRGKVESVKPADGPGSGNGLASADGRAPEHLVPNPFVEFLAGGEADDDDIFKSFMGGA